MTILNVPASIATYLQGISDLSLNFSNAGTKNLFVDFLPDSPDQAVALYERPGAPTLLTLTGGTTSGSQAQSLLDQPVVQMRVRSGPNDYVVGNTLLQQAWGNIQGLNNQKVPASTGMQFLLITASGSPMYLGLDIRQRHEWTINMRVMLLNSQRVPV